MGGVICNVQIIAILTFLFNVKESWGLVGRSAPITKPILSEQELLIGAW
jgi:hypothetical protein